MKKALLFAGVSAFFLVGCTVGFMGSPDGDQLIIVPALPIIVEIDTNEPYYQNGYYYNYQGNVWWYSSHRQGPWKRLPRSRYPREVRHRVQEHHQDDHRDDDEHGNRNK